MLVFRSEAHVSVWLAGRQAGATIGLQKLAELANAWWSDRLSPEWRPHTREANQAILEQLGLNGPFWSFG